MSRMLSTLPEGSFSWNWVSSYAIAKASNYNPKAPVVMDVEVKVLNGRIFRDKHRQHKKNWLFRMPQL